MDLSAEAGGVEARVLTREAEVVAVAAHAVYKERIPLPFMVREWLNGRAFLLAEELRAGEAVRLCLELNRLIERGLVEAPVKLGLARVVWVLLGKFAGDPWFRGSSLNVARLAARRRTVHQLVWRVRRRSY